VTTISLKFLLLKNVHLDLCKPLRGLSKPLLELVLNLTLVLQSRNYIIIYSLFNRLQKKKVKEVKKVGKIGKIGKVGKVNNAQKINNVII